MPGRFCIITILSVVVMAIAGCGSGASGTTASSSEQSTSRATETSIPGEGSAFIRHANGVTITDPGSEYVVLRSLTELVSESPSVVGHPQCRAEGASVDHSQYQCIWFNRAGEQEFADIAISSQGKVILKHFDTLDAEELGQIQGE